MLPDDDLVTNMVAGSAKKLVLYALIIEAIVIALIDINTWMVYDIPFGIGSLAGLLFIGI